MFLLCKQKTAYELRISDWSSDACSSDLGPQPSDLVQWTNRDWDHRLEARQMPNVRTRQARSAAGNTDAALQSSAQLHLRFQDLAGRAGGHRKALHNRPDRRAAR